MPPVRITGRAAGALLALASVAPAVPAADFPQRPVRLVVPFAPGGANDLVARLLSQKLTLAWGQSVVVDNRGGASGTIGTDLVAKAAPDGHTLLMANINFAVNPAVLKSLPYDTLRDFAPVAMLAASPSVLVTSPASGLRTVQDLVQAARAKPGAINYATPGAGGTGHLAMGLLESLAGVSLNVIHYKGGGPALIDLLAGRVPVTFATSLSVMQHVESGRLRAMAVSGPARSPALPDVPTVAESGVPGYAFTSWWGMVAPAKTPPATVRTINAALLGVMAPPDVGQYLARNGVEPATSSPEAFAAHVKAETARWAKVVRDTGIRAE